MRRILIIAGIALAIIVVASYAAWALMRPAPATPTTGISTNFFLRLFPFNQTPRPSTQVPSPNQQPGASAQQPIPRLREISSKPVAGGSPFVVGTTTAIMIRFVERETGRVYETPADATTVTRISNTTIPRIEKVLWIDSNHFILTYLNDADAPQNFYATLVPGKTEQSLNGSFLASWNRAALDPTGKNLLAVTETASGARFTLSRSDGTNAKTVFTSPLRSWIPFESANALYAATAASAGIPGYLYRILNGTLTKVAGGILGMTVLPSPSGRYVALSSGQENIFSLSVIDTKTGVPYLSPLATLASKCAWASESPPTLICGVPKTLPTGEYPNDWLLGNIAFADDIWRIEPVNGTATVVASPERDAATDMDVWQPAIAGSYLTFINKRDLTFWSLNFLEEGEATTSRQ